MGNRKLPFGYKMVMGEIVVHPQEAQAEPLHWHRPFPGYPLRGTVTRSRPAPVRA